MKPINRMRSEEFLHKQLLEYDSVISLLSTPTLFHRFTGQIIKVNKGFCSLLKCSGIDIMNNGALYQILDELSMVNFYERLVELVASKNMAKSVMTCVNLVRVEKPHRRNGVPAGRKVIKIPCTVSTIVKFDINGLPVMFASTFIPMESTEDTLD